MERLGHGGDHDSGRRENVSFATPENVDGCIQFLNHTLELTSFPLLPLLSGQESISMAAACNCIYALLQYNQRQASYREASMDQQQRLQSEIKRLEKRLEKSEGQNEAKESQIQTLLAKELKSASGSRTQLTKLQAEKDEFQRMATSAQQLKAQYLHESKKREKEFSRLQDKLNSLMADKKEKPRAAIDIQNPPQKEPRARATWTGKKAEGDFYKTLIDGYEARKFELLAENGQLKDSLKLIQSQLLEIMVDFGLQEDSSEARTGGLAAMDSTPQRDTLALPYELAREKVEAAMIENLALIREELFLLEARVTEKLSEGSKAPELSQNTPKTRLKFMENVQRERAELESEIKNLEEERQALRAMAARLDKEETEIEEEKRNLAEQQNSFNSILQLWAPAVAEKVSLSEVMEPGLLQRLKNVTSKDR